MADLKISQLSNATTPLAGTETLPIVQSGATKKTTVDDILTTGRNASFGSVTATSKYVISGNGSAPSASEIGFGTNGVGSRARYNAPSGGEHEFSVNGSNIAVIAGGAITPASDNVASAGLSFWRYSVVYAATGTINTSDARTKQQVSGLSAAESAVAKRIKGLIKTFKFNDAVESKGEGARIHVGVIAQEVAAAFEAEGLDPHKYAIFCFDSWEDMFEDVYEEQQFPQDDGTVQTVSVKTGERLVVKAGERFGIRYDQLLAFIIAAL